MNRKNESLLTKNLWLLFGLLGLIGFFVVWIGMPHQPEIKSVGQLILKIFIFIAVSFSVAFFPNNSPKKHLLLVLPFFIFLGFLIPRTTFFAYVAIPQNWPNAEHEFYTFIWVMLFPAITMCIGIAYRIGGGTPGQTLKITLSSIIILFSGYLDFMWYTVNPVEMPDALIYAHHIELILGHYPSYTETIIFSLFHIPILIALLILPIDKWFSKINATQQYVLVEDKK